VADYTREHREAVADLEICVDKREFDRQKLDSVYVSIFALEKFCTDHYLPKPAFWFPGEGGAIVVPPRREQIDKQVCQGIARTLWDQDPTFTIKALTQHPAILRNGNGGLYSSKTLHAWLSEVDPRSIEDNTGRPRKPSQG